MDRLESMTAFVGVARAGGFSAASRELGIPLATLSRRVAELESALGVRLLHRSTRQVVVTDAGRAFFAECQRALDDLRDAEDAVTSEHRTPRGDLLLTAPIAFGRLHLQPIALDFLAAYPQINLRLQLIDKVLNIADDHIDLALRIAHLPDSSLTARTLGSTRLLVCGSPAYLKAHGAPLRPEDLMQHDCIAWATLGPRDTWWFRGDSGPDSQYAIRTRLATTLAEMRLVKDAIEIEELRAVIASTKRGFDDVIKRLKKAKSEREVEGVFGLRRAMQEAGAQAVLMSLWAVPDRETQELMTLFYGKWLAGEDKQQALREAEMELRRRVSVRYGRDLPFYWGGFVLVGKTASSCLRGFPPPIREQSPSGRHALQRPALRDPGAPRCICEGPDASTHRTGQRKLNHGSSGPNFHKVPFDAPGTLAVRKPTRALGERAVDFYRLNVCIEDPILDIGPEIPCKFQGDLAIN